MIKNFPPLQKPSLSSIRTVFPSATGAGIILPEIGRGLAVHFNRSANFFTELNIPQPSKNVISEPLFRLVETFGFVVLRNCVVRGITDNGLCHLSHGKDSDGKFIQDPYHYDGHPHQAHYMSAIYKTQPDAREEDTLYALESDVKQAIGKLPKDEHSIEVIDALYEMMKPDYHFRLFHADENLARQVIKFQYPHFVDDVFNLIPEGRKYRQKWRKDVWDVFVHANIFGDGLHARPTGHMMTRHEPRHNPLRGLEIYGG